MRGGSILPLRRAIGPNLSAFPSSRLHSSSQEICSLFDLAEQGRIGVTGNKSYNLFHYWYWSDLPWCLGAVYLSASLTNFTHRNGSADRTRMEP